MSQPSESAADRVRARARETGEVGREVVALLQAEQVTFLAAAIAYYAFVSLLPALLLVLAVAATVGGEDLATEVVDSSGDALSPVGQDLVRETIVSASGRAPATLVSLPVLAWSTLKVFRGLSIAFARIYGTAADLSFLDQVRDAAVVLGGVALGVGALVAVNTVVGFVDAAGAGLLGTLVLVVFLTVAFLPLYYVFPDADSSVRTVLPGTVLAAVGWTVLGTVFRVYAGMAGQFALYGVLGVVLLLVTWFYVGSLVLLAGATLNAVLAARADETGTHKRPPADSPDSERV